MNKNISLQELRSALLRRVFRRRSHYADLAARTWSLAPAITLDEPPAIYLEGELERVGAVQEETTREIEWARLAGGPKEHIATTAYLFKDVKLRSGRLLKGAMSHRVSHLATLAPASSQVDMDSAAIASTLLGSIYFGHWMRDDSSMHLAVKSLAPMINVARQHYSHEAGYCELLSLREQQVARANFRELILLDDWGHNADRRRRFAQLRATFRQSVPLSGNSRVYIRRGSAVGARGRNLRNGDEVEQFLRAQGFAVVDPDTMSAAEIARIANGARLIVGLEGSHLGHAIYPIADGGALLVLQPPMRFNNVYKDVADSLGLRYAFTVGEQAEDGFHIDLGRLGRLLDRVAA